jgi:Spy/CpxP family protein refolding chaperone
MKNILPIQKLAVTAGLLAMLGAPVWISAQETNQSTGQSDTQGPAQAKGRHEDELSRLNLSEDQQAQVKKIHMDMKSQVSAVQNDSTLSGDQKQAKIEEIRKASHKQVKQLLTPEQRQQMKADEQARKAARQQGSTPPAAPPQQ